MTLEELKKRIVLVHDSFTQLGGAERVVKGFCEMFPEAPLYALVSDKEVLRQVTGRECKTSYLQNLYSAGVPFKYLLPLIPPATGSLEFPKGAIILSSSSLFLKGIFIPEGGLHIQYIHTPPRFLWTDPEYVTQEVPFYLRFFASIYLKRLKNWDKVQASKVTHFIANSNEVASRIKKYYDKDASVIYPFVDTNFWKPTVGKGDYFLMGGRLQAHKNYDFVLDTFKKNKKNLKVVGAGRHAEELKKMAPENVDFLGRVTDEELRDLYSGALGFIFPPIEDAGLMPLEAAACGTATLAISKGGSLETVEKGITGEYFDSYESEEIFTILENWDYKKYETVKLVSHAEKFGKQRFFEQITEKILSIVNNVP